MCVSVYETNFRGQDAIYLGIGNWNWDRKSKQVDKCIFLQFSFLLLYVITLLSFYFTKSYTESRYKAYKYIGIWKSMARQTSRFSVNSKAKKRDAISPRPLHGWLGSIHIVCEQLDFSTTSRPEVWVKYSYSSLTRDNHWHTIKS